MQGGAKRSGRMKKPGWRYAQELIVRGELLKVRMNCLTPESANRSTRLEAEFSTQIYDICAAFAAGEKHRASRGGVRWRFLEGCLKEAGKPSDMRELQDFAAPLDVEQNMLTDSRLLRDECRAAIGGVCHMLVGLGLMKANEADERGMIRRAKTLSIRLALAS